MSLSAVEYGRGAGAPLASCHGGVARALLQRVPRPIRFLGVGGFGLSTDILVFSLLLFSGVAPLAARALSLVLATAVTWRLNRLVTFASTGRAQQDEGFRYAAVTVAAQGTSYLIFSALILTVLARLPQAALIAGAAVGALVSYNGHRLFSFAPRTARALPQS
jgi:putative flippase GtrA